METIVTFLMALILISMIAALLAIFLWPVKRWEKVLDVILLPVKALRGRELPEITVPVEIESERKEV
jgi:hypothetical protein